MLNWNRPYVYMQLEPDLLMVKDIGTGRYVAEEPFAAVRTHPQQQLLAVGAAAKMQSLTVGVALINPFKHCRTLLGDIRLGEAVLRGFFKKLYAERYFAPAPRVLLQPRINPLGGLAPIEIKALKTLAMNAGASSVTLWHGRSLTDQEVRKFRFDSRSLQE